MLLEDVIRLHLPRLYHGYEILSCHAIRVTRDAELQLPRGRAEDLLTSIEESLQDRLHGLRGAAPVRHRTCPAQALTILLEELELAPDDLYEAQGFIAFADLFQLYGAVDLPRLKDKPVPPQPVPQF